MTRPIVQEFSDVEQLSRAAAEEFVRMAGHSIAARGRLTVALAGGSTPRRLYQLLAEASIRDRVDWSNVEFFWGDERAVPPNHADSNFRMANEALLQRVATRSGQVHRLQAERADLDDAARDYQVEIARVFSVPADGPPPAFDLILLGMGPDGHTASLFPDTAALDETTRWVVPNWVPKFETFRLTFTLPILNRAAEVMFLVAGTDKAAVLTEVLEGPPDPARLPSQSIRPAQGALVWMIDRAAAGRLTQKLNT